ncbi:MAG: exodeoxyribonuclease VII large subunit [Kiritimatiellae bacterium]|nr:exodeoxyribonuclease VII large subunit [Kiritimatiellia bacterium]
MKGSTQDDPLSVTALAAAVKSALETGFSRLFVEGEISGWRPYPSGHVYFTLKDAGAQMPAVMFKGNFVRCKARERLRDGAKVLVYATATLYSQRGTCQLVVLDAKVAGEGDLMQRFLELKARLEAEGLFAPERKPPLPRMPRRIAMATSLAGAVVHDMCRTIARRFPRVEIRVFPCAVQGAEAPRSVVAALERINAPSPDGWRADLAIVARGGGSFEDLFCFNDESLVRAVAASRIPVISAVGHETDYTLCDFAAARRAGTPSIAAEMAVPELAPIEQSLERAKTAMAAALRGKYRWFAQCVDGYSDRLASSLKYSLSSAEAHLREISSKIALLSPYSVLGRGYSLVTDAKGRVVKSGSDVAPGDMIDIRLAEGAVSAKVASCSPLVESGRGRS